MLVSRYFFSEMPSWLHQRATNMETRTQKGHYCCPFLCAKKWSESREIKGAAESTFSGHIEQFSSSLSLSLSCRPPPCSPFVFGF